MSQKGSVRELTAEDLKNIIDKIDFTPTEAEKLHFEGIRFAEESSKRSFANSKLKIGVSCHA